MKNMLTACLLACTLLWTVGCTMKIVNSSDDAPEPSKAAYQPGLSTPVASFPPSKANPNLRSTSPLSQKRTPPSILSSRPQLDPALSQSGAEGPRPVIQSHLSASQDQTARRSKETETDVTALRSTYARLISEMGTASEQQKLQNWLTGQTDNAALWEYMVSLQLAQGELDAARYWMSQANAHGQPLPAWQRLNLALRSDDRETVQNLLDDPTSGLTPTDRLQALQKLGLDSEALTLAHELLESGSSADDSSELRQQANNLALKLANRITLGTELWGYGSLSVSSALALFNIGLENARTGMNIAANRLHSNSDNLVVNGFDKELDISVPFNKAWYSEQVEAQLGGNLREDKSLAYGRITWGHQINKSLLSRLQFDFNKISNETPALRAIGAKDQLALGLSADLTPWELARTQLKIQRYHTREGDQLARGYAMEGALEHFIFKRSPAWLVRVQGSWENNQLRNNLPKGLEPILGPSAEVSTIVPSEYGLLGIGTTLRYGSAGEEIARNPQGLIDAWTGWVWPSNQIGYNISLGIEISPVGDDRLDFKAFYSNTQGGRTDDAYRGVVLSYTRYF